MEEGDGCLEGDLVGVDPDEQAVPVSRTEAASTHSWNLQELRGVAWRRRSSSPFPPSFAFVSSTIADLRLCQTSETVE